MDLLYCYNIILHVNSLISGTWMFIIIVGEYISIFFSFTNFNLAWKTPIHLALVTAKCSDLTGFTH